jgi:hypothetical protein
MIGNACTGCHSPATTQMCKDARMQAGALAKV